MVRPGQSVVVYLDPLTEKVAEDTAKVLKAEVVGEHEGRKLFACMVEFKDGARCYRKVLD